MSDEELMLDVGQANEIKLAARRAGATNEDLKRLSEGSMLAYLLPVIRGQAEVTMKPHVINLDLSPFIPNGCLYREEDQLLKRVRGEFVWDPAKVNLHLSPNQQGGRYIVGTKLRKELENEKHAVLGANVLDYLLEHPELIPDSWKGKAVFFWGTIYRISDGSLVVRCLCWRVGRWFSFGLYLVNDWHETNPALVRAS